MATLRLVPPAGSHIEIDGDQAVVGRDPNSDVVINDGSVSRKHARLERRGDGWAVVDQGSANGTFIDGHRITDVEMRNGQEIRFGSVAYQVEIEGDELSATILTPIPAPTDATVVHQRAVTAPPPRPPAPQARPVAPAARPVAPPPRPQPPAQPPPSPRPHPVTPVPHAAHPPEPEAKKKGPMFWGAIGCAGCLVVSLIGFGAVFGTAYFLTGGAVDVARAQLKEMKEGNLEAAYARTTAGYQTDHSTAAFAAFVGRHPGLKGNTDATFSNRKLENDTATLTGTLAHAAGTENVVYRLVKEGDTWKVSGLTVEGDEGAGAAIPGDAGGLKVETIAVNKSPHGQALEVKIDVRVTGFDLRPDGQLFRMDLVEDLETVGPEGRIDELSQVGLQSLNRTTTSAVGATATFNTKLTFGKIVPGKYKAIITIRDLIGSKTQRHEVPFDLP